VLLVISEIAVFKAAFPVPRSARELIVVHSVVQSLGAGRSLMVVECRQVMRRVQTTLHLFNQSPAAMSHATFSAIAGSCGGRRQTLPTSLALPRFVRLPASCISH